jgi:hypothetical protein
MTQAALYAGVSSDRQGDFALRGLCRAKPRVDDVNHSGLLALAVLLDTVVECRPREQDTLDADGDLLHSGKRI